MLAFSGAGREPAGVSQIRSNQPELVFVSKATISYKRAIWGNTYYDVSFLSSGTIKYVMTTSFNREDLF
jgi:hypothetical protein